MPSKEEILAKLEPIEDPEIRVGLVDLGLIYDIEFPAERNVRISMTLTTPGCPYGPRLVQDVKDAVLSLDGVKDVEVEVVFEPPWNPVEMASEYAKDVLGIW
jgi:metal-sulfur cluster biosynthetic enzyme